MRYDVLRNLISKHLHAEYDGLRTHAEVHDWRDVEVLAQHVDRIWIGECGESRAEDLIHVKRTLS